jgi:hypothetical protein
LTTPLYDAGDVDRRVIEPIFATRHRSTIRGFVSEAIDVFRSLVEIKDRRREGRTPGIQPERIVDADEKSGQLLLQGNRAAGGVI